MAPSVPLHIDVDGTGPTLVLAHGFGGSARNFGPQARALRDRWQVVRYDARGHARSAAPSDPTAYTPEAAVDDLRRVLDQVGAQQAVVGGLSMGAATALRFALAEPARTLGLVLAAYPAGPEARGGFTALAEPFAAAIEHDGIEAAGDTFVWGPSSGLDPQAAQFVRQGFLEHPAHGLPHTLRGVLARQPALAELAPALRALDRPALVIVGDGDRASLGPSRVLADTLPAARLVVVPGAGHVVNLAQPALFNATLTEFLAALPAA